MQNEVPVIPNTPFAGGFYAGRIRIDDINYAIIVAPKAEGEHDDIAWNRSVKNVAGALSYCDGLTNTNAMVEAGSRVAKWARDLRIGGFDDWYLPSQDELEVCYRNLKPGTDENALWGRSGINVSAVPPTYPYTAEVPKQTESEDFRKGGAQAFEPEWYWTSTQHAGDAGYAWVQNVGDGGQSNGRKGNYYRARAVRRLKI